MPAWGRIDLYEEGHTAAAIASSGVDGAGTCAVLASARGVYELLVGVVSPLSGMTARGGFSPGRLVVNHSSSM